MSKVFLGGTCSGANWREKLAVDIGADIELFDPVVDDWTPECQAIEEIEKRFKCSIHLYLITSDMTGVFSIAEAIESAMTLGKLCIFHVIPAGFDDGQIKSLQAVADMVKKHGGVAYIDSDLGRTARLLLNCGDIMV